MAAAEAALGCLRFARMREAEQVAARGPARVRLRLRGTFIDVDDGLVLDSPRAHSEPRKPVQAQVEFEEQRAYLAKLSSTCEEGIPLARTCASERGYKPHWRGDESWSEAPWPSPDRRQASPSQPHSSWSAAWDNAGAELPPPQQRVSSRGPVLRGGTVATEETQECSPNSGRARSRRGRPSEAPQPQLPVCGSATSSTAGAQGAAVSDTASSSSSAPSAAVRGDSVIMAVTGKWRVADGNMRGSVWTIEEGGRMLFNGKRFGAEYDLRRSGGPFTIVSADGWMVTLDPREPDVLVWFKQGEDTRATWTRLPASPEELARRQHPPGKRRPNETKTQLQSKMQASAQKMSAGWVSEGRLNSAMAAIEEIPMRISEDMQRAASFVVDNMQSEVAAMSKQIRGGDWAMPAGSSDDSEEWRLRQADTEKVIKNLEVIPTMVHNLLEARVEKARFKVRHRVHGMIQNLSAIKEENWEDHEGLVSQMRMISEEVEQIAGDAVLQAAQECHAHAVKHMNSALTALRESTHCDGEDTSPRSRPRWSDMMGEGSGGGCGGWGVSHDPDLWSKTVSGMSAKNSMEQVAAVVQDKGYIPQSFTNQVVADELLRARIRRGGGQSEVATVTASGAVSSRGGNRMAIGAARAAPHAAPGVNPGSRGHPDLCTRPCLYFAQGSCTNGDGCSFCHLAHPKRPVRFDKLHRESLKRMPFGQFCFILLPVLRQKAADLILAPGIQEALDRMWPALEEEAAAAEGGDASCSAVDGRGQFDLGPFRESVGGSAISSNTSISGSEQSIARRGSFAGALQAMGFRPLLSMLLSKASTDAPAAGAVVDNVLKSIHESHQLGQERADGNSWMDDIGLQAAAAADAERDRHRRRGPVGQPAAARQASFQHPRQRQRHRTDSLFSAGSRSPRGAPPLR